MGKELAAHALYMKEQSEANRMSKLSTQYDLSSKKLAVEAATTEVKQLEKAVRRSRLTSNRCWQQHARAGLIT